MSIQDFPQVLDLQNAHNFMNTLQRLNYFVHNVPLEMMSFSRTQILNQISNQLVKSFSEHKIKTIKPWIHFVQRLNNENLGITTVHFTLLSILVREQLYKLAFNLIQLPGLPLSISIQKYRHYLVLSAQVYKQYEKYSESLECLELAHGIQDYNFELSFFIMKLLILTRRQLGLECDKRDFIKELDKIKNYCQYQLHFMVTSDPIKISDFEFEVQLFCAICEDKELSKNQIQYLQDKQLIQEYQKGLNKSIRQLKSYIKKEVRDPTLYRVKCTQIKNQPISQFQTVRNINKFKPIYMYDSKNSIMQFLHQQATQQQIDSIINKACAMRQIIKKRPAEIKGAERQRERTPESDRFSDYPGSGGSGGFIGMVNSISGILGFSKR